MNLYYVWAHYERNGFYVFHESHGKAKAMLMNQWNALNPLDYTSMRAQLVKENVGGKPEVCWDDCPRLEALGITYGLNQAGIWSDGFVKKKLSEVPAEQLARWEADVKAINAEHDALEGRKVST